MRNQETFAEMCAVFLPLFQINTTAYIKKRAFPGEKHIQRLEENVRSNEHSNAKHLVFLAKFVDFYLKKCAELKQHTTRLVS